MKKMMLLTLVAALCGMVLAPIAAVAAPEKVVKSQPSIKQGPEVAPKSITTAIGDMFKSVVGKVVVQTASQKIAEAIKTTKNRNNDKTESSYYTMYTLLESYETVLVAAWGENAWDKMSCARGKWNPDEMSAEEKQRMLNWREELFNDGRKYLQNPTALFRVYQTFKPSIIEGIRKAQAEKEMRDYLSGISKYFTASADARNIMERLIEGGVDFSDKFDLYAFKFAERRRAEGGDQIVELYRQIIEDLAASL